MTLDEPSLLDAGVEVEGSTPVKFLDSVFQAYQEAERATGGAVDRFYDIGGYPIRLRFAGSALVPYITPALEHLAIAPFVSPALTVCLWDSVSTRTPMPPPPWSHEDYLARGEIRGYNDSRIHTAFQIGANILSLLDLERDLAIFWIRDVRQVPVWETGAPLRTILHWWMRGRGGQLIHAAAVGTARGGVLLAGKGGTGKSTTALAALASGLLYAGDDYVLLGKSNQPFVYSLYNSAKVELQQLQKAAYLAAALGSSDKRDGAKALFFLHPRFSTQVAVGFPVRAILIPKITGLGATRFKVTSAASSLAALAPSTIFQLSGAYQEDWQNLSKFVRQVPSYTLELGTDLSEIAAAIDHFLSGE